MNAPTPLHTPRLVRELNSPGWLVVYRSYGWLFGSRSEALCELRRLADEVRR
jgi:hypothetical protein